MDAADHANTLRWRIRHFPRALDNWRRGFAYGYVRRCRVCGHTTYVPNHCSEPKEHRS